jgi:hypothetical protein
VPRANGITEQTDYRWKAKYGGMELSEMQRLKQLDDDPFGSLLARANPISELSPVWRHRRRSSTAGVNVARPFDSDDTIGRARRLHSDPPA